MIPTRPILSDVVNHTIPVLNDGLRLVATWRDLECGCTRNDRGAWIVTTSCDEHIGLIPAEVRRDAWPLSATGVDYGPFLPDLAPVAPSPVGVSA